MIPTAQGLLAVLHVASASALNRQNRFASFCSDL